MDLVPEKIKKRGRRMAVQFAFLNGARLKAASIAPQDSTAFGVDLLPFLYPGRGPGLFAFNHFVVGLPKTNKIENTKIDMRVNAVAGGNSFGGVASECYAGAKS
jgi:hypothetical protein